MAPTDSSDIMGSKSDICEKAIDFLVSFFSDYVKCRIHIILSKVEIHVVLEIFCFILNAIDLDKIFHNH